MTTNFDLDGFQIVARTEDDSDADTSYLEQAGFEDRLAEYRNGQFEFIGVIVKAYKAGVELAVDSLWGIESDSGDDYLNSTVTELATEAVSDAKKKLAELCKD